jgi:hypothetical protein
MYAFHVAGTGALARASIKARRPEHKDPALPRAAEVALVATPALDRGPKDRPANLRHAGGADRTLGVVEAQAGIVNVLSEMIPCVLGRERNVSQAISASE